MTKCPSHLTATQIRNALCAVLYYQARMEEVEIKHYCHPQRIKREMLKRGAEKWHGVLMLESTAATQFIHSHLAFENLKTTEPTNTETMQPEG